MTVKALRLRDYLLTCLGKEEFYLGIFVARDSPRLQPSDLVLMCREDGLELLLDLGRALVPSSERLEVLSGEELASIALPEWDTDLVGEAEAGASVYEAILFFLQHDAPWHLTPRSKGGGAEG